MKTKLVYVLTCAPEATYIEQALMSVWTARHWNPDAHIVLITDNLTDNLLVGKRGEILNYISEKIVIPFEDDSLSMMYRSRFIKTSVRQLIEGDFLFIDCDTIVCKSLADVDGFTCKIGAVYESHLPIAELNEQMQHGIEKNAQKVGWSIKNEQYYFSSGVIYTKDVPETHQLYQSWHKKWLDGIANGINIDQPTFAYANIHCGHIVELIPDSYNCILFTEPQHTREAHILHIAAFRNPSVLFTETTLGNIRKNGLQDDVIQLICKPYESFLPFDYDILHSSFFERISWLRYIASLQNGFLFGILWLFRKRIHVLRHRDSIKNNSCRK